MKSKDIDIMLTRKELYSIGQLSEQGNLKILLHIIEMLTNTQMTDELSKNGLK